MICFSFFYRIYIKFFNFVDFVKIKNITHFKTCYQRKKNIRTTFRIINSSMVM